MRRQREKTAEFLANFKGYDGQATRAESRREGRIAGREEGRKDGIEKFILASMDFGVAKEKVIEQLIKRFGLTEQEAEENIQTLLFM